MADSINKNIERRTPASTPDEKVEKPEKIERGEVKEKTREFIEGVSEAVEGSESSEFAEGDVSEKTKEGKKKAADGTAGGGASTATAARIAMPDFEEMVIQVRTKIKVQLAALENERKKIMRHPTKFNPFKLTEVVSKIRELKDLLEELATATKERMKQLWQRFVQGTKK